MKKFREKIVREISGYVCDRCGREAETQGGEAEELVSIDRVGGYYSIFGMAIESQSTSASIVLKKSWGSGYALCR